MSSSKVVPPVKPTGLNYIKTEDFSSTYANNVYLESSQYDLKLIFGQVDQSISPNAIVQSSAVTIPWVQAKLLIYLMRVHVIAHEANMGKISVPPGTIAPVPKQMPENVKAAYPGSSWESLRKLYEEFVAANPEVKLA